MKKPQLMSGVMLAAALLSVGAAAGDTSVEERSAPAVLYATPDSQLNARLDSAFKELTRRNLFSGTVLVAKGDHVLFQGAYGLASREYDVPNTMNTQFNLGSANKMFAAVSIAQLMERGKLKFDDPIGNHLGADWIDPQIGRKVTIAHLLTHTSGLSEIFASDELRKGSKELYKEIKDLQPIAVRSTLTREPGTQWSYCNTNFLLLGVIVEKLSGQSYFDYLQKNIFEPAGMTRTAALDLERINKGYAQGYGKQPKVQTPMPARGPKPPPFREIVTTMADLQEQLEREGYDWVNNVFRHFAKGTPQGGMVSTAADLPKFANAFNSGKLLQPRTARLMSTPKPPVAPHWGYGIMMTDAGGYGHGGGFVGINAFLIMYPDGYTVVALSNVDGGAYVAVNELMEQANLLPKAPSKS